MVPKEAVGPVVGIIVIQGGETTRDTKRWSNRRAVEAVAPVDRVVATGEVEISNMGMGLGACGGEKEEDQGPSVRVGFWIGSSRGGN